MSTRPEDATLPTEFRICSETTPLFVKESQRRDKPVQKDTRTKEQRNAATMATICEYLW